MSLHTSTEQDNELAKLAYASVREIPTVEMNDRNRLGYHVWLFLRGEIPTLKSAIEQSRSRYLPRDRGLEVIQDVIETELEKLKSGEVNIDEIEIFPNRKPDTQQ
jgi:hypothetical protein